MKPMLNARNITIGHARKPLLDGISFDILPGECILLCGANGSGKSTLMKSLAGNLPLIEGEILSTGKVIMVPTRIPKVQGFSIEAFIMTGFYADSPWHGRISASERRAVEEAMEVAGIIDLRSKDLSETSDGEFQKACIASALAKRAGVLLLDEPTAFLDVENRAAVLSALKKLAQTAEVAILFSSHDLYDSTRICTRVLGIGIDGQLHDSDKEGKTSAIKACFKNKILIFDNL